MNNTGIAAKLIIILTGNSMGDYFLMFEESRSLMAAISSSVNSNNPFIFRDNESSVMFISWDNHLCVLPSNASFICSPIVNFLSVAIF